MNAFTSTIGYNNPPYAAGSLQQMQNRQEVYGPSPASVKLSQADKVEVNNKPIQKITTNLSFDKPEDFIQLAEIISLWPEHNANLQAELNNKNKQLEELNKAPAAQVINGQTVNIDNSQQKAALNEQIEELKKQIQEPKEIQQFKQKIDQAINGPDLNQVENWLSIIKSMGKSDNATKAMLAIITVKAQNMQVSDQGSCSLEDKAAICTGLIAISNGLGLLPSKLRNNPSIAPRIAHTKLSAGDANIAWYFSSAVDIASLFGGMGAVQKARQAINVSRQARNLPLLPKIMNVLKNPFSLLDPDIAKGAAVAPIHYGVGLSAIQSEKAANPGKVFGKSLEDLATDYRKDPISIGLGVTGDLAKAAGAGTVGFAVGNMIVPVFGGIAGAIVLGGGSLLMDTIGKRRIDDISTDTNKELNMLSEAFKKNLPDNLRTLVDSSSYSSTSHTPSSSNGPSDSSTDIPSVADIIS